MSTNSTTGNEKKRNPIEERLRNNFQSRFQQNADVENLLDLVIDTEEEFCLPILITEMLEDGGPPTDSMGPTKHETELSKMGGYDTIELGLHGEWDEKESEELFKTLAEQKTEAQEHGEAFLTIDDKKFLVRPMGFKAGRKVYDYVIEASGVVIGMAEKFSKSHAAIRIRYGFEALIGRDAFAVHEAILELLGRFGFNCTKERVSRADLTVDILDIPVENLINPILRDEAVYRAKKADIHTESGKPTSIRLGGGVQLCIYDKKRELLEKHDEIKFSLMVEHRFNGDIPNSCSRVEFRIKREKLKEMGIDTMNDLREMQTDLAEFLHSHWFRILDGKKQKGHTAEQPVSEIWGHVQKTFDAAFQPITEESRTINRDWNKPRAVLCDQEAMIKQAIGCLARAVALSGNAVSIETTESYLTSIYETEVEEIHKKALMIGEKTATARGVDLSSGSLSESIPFGEPVTTGCNCHTPASVPNVRDWYHASCNDIDEIGDF